jgi:drug/metabolite transporter (DMT)-like permease
VTAASLEARRPAQGAFLLLVAISLFWGLNWPVMKLALGKIPVLPFRALCLLASGPAMLGIAALSGAGLRVPRREIAPLLVAALFNVTLWHIFTGVGVSLMPAGRASIIAYTMPAWASLLSALVLGERLTRRRLAGLGLGMAGLASLMLPSFESILAAPLGVLSMILAAFCWATGTVVMKRFPWSGSVAALTGWQICLGGVPIVLAALIIGPFPGLGAADGAAIAALAYIVVFGMIIGQWGWFVVLARLPVSVASISTLAIPVIGVLSSALLLGERLGASEITALMLVVAALALVTRAQR